MSIIMRDSNGNIGSVSMPINCREYRTEVGEDGIIENIECISRTVKSECKMCGLMNAVEPQHGDIDSKG